MRTHFFKKSGLYSWKYMLLAAIVLFMLCCLGCSSSGDGDAGGVQDNSDAINDDTGDVGIVNQSPTCAILNPIEEYVYQVDNEITFEAFGDDPDGEIIDYTWDFGDGNTSTGKVVTHKFIEEGSYNVKLTVTDNNNESTSLSLLMNINHGFSVSGRVTSSGLGSEGVELTISGVSEYATVTDSDGYFAFEDLNIGEYLVVATDDKYNFSPEGVEFEITNQDITEISFSAFEFIVLYDVDFSSPLHTIGEPPNTTSIQYPRESPTEIVFGTPHVVDSFYTLEDQPCVFGGPEKQGDRYDQIQFGIKNHYDIYDQFSSYSFEMKLLIHELVGANEYEAFTILIDSPWVRRIDFLPDNTIELSIPGHSIIGTYNFDEVMEIFIVLDVNRNQMQIIMDGQELFSGYCFLPTISSIRLNMYPSSADSVLAIDDVLIKEISNKSIVNYWLFDGYEYNLIHYPGSDFTECRGLNDMDEVVGSYWIDGEKYNFLLSSGDYKTLELENELNPVLQDINNNGAMIGNYDTGYSYGFVVDEQGNTENIVLDEYTFTGGISNIGVVVSSNNTNKIFLSDDTGDESFESHFITDTPKNYSTGINNFTDIVGNVAAHVGYLVNSDAVVFNAYVYDGNDFNDINHPDAITTYASGINDNGVVSGFYLDSDGKHSIFTLEDGVFKTLEQVDGYSSFSLGINNFDHILGATIKSPYILRLE